MKIPTCHGDSMISTSFINFWAGRFSKVWYLMNMNLRYLALWPRKGNNVSFGGINKFPSSPLWPSHLPQLHIMVSAPPHCHPSRGGTACFEIHCFRIYNVIHIYSLTVNFSHRTDMVLIIHTMTASSAWCAPPWSPHSLSRPGKSEEPGEVTRDISSP